MTGWKWFDDFEQDARLRRDEIPTRLLNIHDNGFQLRETDPNRALALFGEGERLARAYGHPWWILLFEQWQVHGMIFFKSDYRNILDRAVHNLLRVRQPTFTGYPLRLHLVCDLLAIYQAVDPQGYDDEIAAAITHYENEVPGGDDEFRYLLQMKKIKLALFRNRLVEAKDLTLQAMNWLESEADVLTAQHYLVDISGYLAAIHFQLGNWTDLAASAAVMEEAARRSTVHRYALNNALMWQAVAARQLGDTMQGARFFRSAQVYQGKLGTVPILGFYNAWASYLELEGSFHETLQVRTRHYRDSLNRGMRALECWLLIELCRLKTLVSSLQSEDEEIARRVAARLRKPKDYLASLERALAGEPGTVLYNGG